MQLIRARYTNRFSHYLRIGLGPAMIGLYEHQNAHVLAKVKYRIYVYFPLQSILYFPIIAFIINK